MERNKWKQAFDRMNPSEEKKEELWETIVMQKNIRKHHVQGILFLKYVTAAVLLLFVITVTGLGINAATGGALASAVRQSPIGGWLGFADSEEIVDKASNIASEGMYSYAPEILYVDEEILLFGNLRGILVYDRKQDKVVGTIDTQAIDCIYFDGGKIQTCVVKEAELVLVFNEKEGVQYGDLYQYSLSDSSGKESSVEKVPYKKGEFNRLYALWKENQNQYIDTFNRFSPDNRMAFLFGRSAGEDRYRSYSERSKQWTDEKGRKEISLLSIVGGAYRLYTFSPETDKWKKQDLKLEKKESSQKEADDLPEFVYTGKDPYIEPIISYFRKIDSDDPDDPISEKTVWIPEFIIVDTIEKEDEVCIFGCFGSTIYIRTGALLEARGGAGSNPACVHLKRTPGGYKVIHVDRPRDGAYYSKDIRKFTKGHVGLYQKMINSISSDKEAKKARKKYLKMYIKHNKLDIKYYKDSGWDAVKIME